jgi:hypothetical protein
MKRLWVFLILLTLLGAVGCEKKESAETVAETTGVKAMAVCPTCRMEMPEDAYCASCNAVATTESKPVHCENCDKDFKPGTYCAHCNRFMLNAKVHCGNCRDIVVKGHYCTNEKLFKGLPDIAYCEKHSKPYAKTQTCPDCKKQVTETNI